MDESFDANKRFRKKNIRKLCELFLTKKLCELLNKTFSLT